MHMFDSVGKNHWAMYSLATYTKAYTCNQCPKGRKIIRSASCDSKDARDEEGDVEGQPTAYEVGQDTPATCAQYQPNVESECCVFDVRRVELLLNLRKNDCDTLQPDIYATGWSVASPHGSYEGCHNILSAIHPSPVRIKTWS